MPIPDWFVFKSVPEYWEKERDGRKSNTVRKLAEDDPRRAIASGALVVLINTETGQHFAREVSDVSEYEGLHIISWRHPY
jgi:hypothetical protein